MDLIHSLSSLAIETQHPYSSSHKEVKRNWLELPADVMSLILLKLGPANILVSAQWVCSSWWKLSKQPHLFRHIQTDELSMRMMRETIDRSCGQLVEFFAVDKATNELLSYMSENCDGLIEMAKKLPQLEEFEIIEGSSVISKDVFDTFGRFCPRLNSCRLNFLLDFTKTDLKRGLGLGLAIAENMPELRHLDLSSYFLTDDGLNAILDGCPHLESLDLRECNGLKFAGDLIERCGNIKVFKASGIWYQQQSKKSIKI